MKMKMVCECQEAVSWTGADTILDGDKSPVNEAENCRFFIFVHENRFTSSVIPNRKQKEVAKLKSGMQIKRGRSFQAYADSEKLQIDCNPVAPSSSSATSGICMKNFTT